MSKVANDGKDSDFLLKTIERLRLLSWIYSLSDCSMGLDQLASKPADNGLCCIQRFILRFMKVKLLFDFILYVPVHNFSVMSGWVLLG